MPGSAIPRRSALVGQLIDSLQRRIHEGRWPVGERIPVEAELIEELGVSRATLRQAVQALVHVGVLETIQGNGTFVRATTELDAVLGRFVGGESLLPILEVRLALESEAAGLAAQRAGPEDHDELDRLVREAGSASPADLEHLNRVATRFHQVVVRSSGNPLIQHFYQAIEAGATKSIMEGSAPQSADALVDEHRAISEAIRSGDAELARRLAREHVLPSVEASAVPGTLCH